MRFIRARVRRVRHSDMDNVLLRNKISLEIGGLKKNDDDSVLTPLLEGGVWSIFQVSCRFCRKLCKNQHDTRTREFEKSIIRIYFTSDLMRRAYTTMYMYVCVRVCIIQNDTLFL